MADAQTRVDDVHGAPEPVPEMPPTAVAFAGKAKDLGALRDAVVDAANVGAGLWFSYLFVLLYLIVAVGGVTHRNLLFESPVKLPFLGVDLPLVGFFVLGPLLFLIVHAYVLLHFAMLADKVGAFHAELQSQIADDTLRAQLRRQLPSNIFVQFLAGPIEVRTGLMGAMLRLIAQISLVAGPLALLVFFQLQFLPYHNEAVSWWQRIAVVADLVLLWTLWPSVARGERSSIHWRDVRRPNVAAAAAASALPVLLVLTIATFPGEWLDKNRLSVPIVPEFGTKSVGESIRLAIRWRTPHQVLVGGDIDLVARKTTSLWSNRLVLPNLEVKPGDNISLRGRHLEGAVLLAAKLPKMDFTAARLEGAVFDDADLSEAKFLCAEGRLKIGVDSTADAPADAAQEHCALLQRASLVGARLDRASFNKARFDGATLDNAQGQNATFDKAEMGGAKLRGAQLQRASFNETHLQRATLDQAQLQNAVFDRAELTGASLEGAHLQGASFSFAQLQGAMLKDAELQGASLGSAKLQGASLDYAQLQGAVLGLAWLQGASLAHADLHGASLYGARLQGASLDNASLHAAWLDNSQLEGTSLQSILAWRTHAWYTLGDPRVVAPIDCLSKKDLCEWTVEKYAALQRLLAEQQSDDFGRKVVLDRIKTLDPAAPLAGEEDTAKHWIDLARSPPSPEDYNRALTELLRRIGCEEDTGGPDVIRGLTRNLYERLQQGSVGAHALATAFLDKANCPGAGGLSADDNAKLTEIRDSTPPQRGGRHGPPRPR